MNVLIISITVLEFAANVKFNFLKGIKTFSWIEIRVNKPARTPRKFAKKTPKTVKKFWWVCCISKPSWEQLKPSYIGFIFASNRITEKCPTPCSESFISWNAFLWIRVLFACSISCNLHATRKCNYILITK